MWGNLSPISNNHINPHQNPTFPNIRPKPITRAKWDSTNKSWYVPAGLDLSKFEKWLTFKQEKSAKYPKDNGVVVVGEHSILDGGAYRISNEGLTKFSKLPIRYKNKSINQMSIAHLSKPFLPC
ncbi:DUF5710 domain-containing protein [Moraxella sp.]|uniref:DUF5710 domain-containing protein n=1 Tax=Moraxella sp. TaxID=479 RepID=UPI0034C5DE65